MLLRHLRGLTEPDVRRLVRQAIEHDGVLDSNDLPRLVTQKHRIFRRDSNLSFEFDPARISDVAGLKALKRWLDRRRAPFLDASAAHARDVLKGIMLLGVQGCGKSLAAERKSRVFIVATSNDIESLPPELVRKGRLDEIFFVDLPNLEARAGILRLHLGKRGQAIRRTGCRAGATRP